MVNEETRIGKKGEIHPQKPRYKTTDIKHKDKVLIQAHEELEMEESFRDFELGMFPKGDPALKEFIPGKYKIKIPSFSFDTTKDKEIGIFLEPVIEKQEELDEE